ncbi:MAG: hypothetical protein ACE5LB_01235 [Acidiferrobacterales bacterium]
MSLAYPGDRAIQEVTPPTGFCYVVSHTVFAIIVYWSIRIIGMKGKLKNFIFGLVIGALAAFPLGINFGRDEPLLSNPFAKRDVKDKVVDTVKEGTNRAIEGAKEKIHEATKPARDKVKRTLQ